MSHAALMGLFGPNRQERLAAAAKAIAPYGFTFDASRANDVREYGYFREAPAAESPEACCFGRIEDAVVEGFEYDYTTTDAERNTSWFTQTLIAVKHPSITGSASIRPDQKHWSTTGAVLDIITWIPPFTVIKLAEWFGNMANPDRIVGDADFDRLYQVHAASNEAAREGLPPALRRAALRIGFRSTLETRPGVLLYTPNSEGFDEKTIVGAFGIATAFIGALHEDVSKRHPMR